jgi:malonyl-CoA O-methyltransferase
LAIDKELILRRFGTSFEGYNKYANVQRRICERLAELLGGLCRAKGGQGKNESDIVVESQNFAAQNYPPDVKLAFEIGAGTGFLTELLVRRWPYAEWFVNDLSPEAERFLRPILPITSTLLWGDAESIEFPQNLDLIASASTVQWFSDMPVFVRKAAAALGPGGVLALTSFGPENFREIRAAAATGLDYLALPQLTSLLRAAGLKIIHAEEWTETLGFETPREVLRYIKTLGLNALKHKSYAKGFNETQLTYHPLIVIAQKQESV